MSENGQAEVDQVILTRDRKTGQFSISGNVMDIDMSLNMLSQATRYLDVQYRIVAALEAQQKVNQRREEMKRVADLMRK